MNRPKLRLAAVAVTAVVAARSKNEPNGIAGATDYTGVTLATNPSSFALHVRLIPESTYFDSTARRDSTIPAHDIPLDSTLFDVTASLIQQNVVIANGLDKMSFASPVRRSWPGGGAIAEAIGPFVAGSTSCAGLLIPITSRWWSNLF